MRQFAAEFLGTYILVFAGCGAIVVNTVSGGAITHPGIALTFGLVVLAMIYAVGDVSGAHLNPAVSLGFVVAGRFPLRTLPRYVLAQCLGALVAGGTLRLLFPDHQTLGATVPSGLPLQSFVLEAILTFILMFVILGVSTGAKEKGVLAGIAVGAVIAFEAMFAGPICGASMNPARSLGPALVSGQVVPMQHLWLYLTAPCLGAIVGVLAFWCTQPRETPEV